MNTTDVSSTEQISSVVMRMPGTAILSFSRHMRQCGNKPQAGWSECGCSTVNLGIFTMDESISEYSTTQFIFYGVCTIYIPEKSLKSDFFYLNEK